jgi:hypothetical protein
MTVIDSIDVTSKQVTDLITRMRRWGLDLITWSKFDKFEFQGFNPERTVASIISSAKKMSLTEEAMHDDIITMVGIGIMKGNVTDRSKLRMSDEGQKEYDVLIKRYGIATSARGKSSTTITIPRMLSAYAGLAVRMSTKLEPKKYMNGKMHSHELPSYMQLTCFASVIPRTLGKQAAECLLFANLCYSVDLATVVSNIDDQAKIKSLFPDQLNYVMLAYKSPYPTEKSRIGLVEELNVKNAYKQIVNVSQRYKLFFPEYIIPTAKEFFDAFSTLTYSPTQTPEIVVEPGPSTEKSTAVEDE